MMADIVYNAFKRHLGSGLVDMDDDAFRIVLLGQGHTPDPGHAVLADVIGHEVPDGGGYAAGGRELANTTWTQDGGTVRFDADDPQWTDATFSARHAVIHAAKTVADVTNPLVCLLDFGEVKTVTSGTFTVRFNENGILSLS
jgi:hypothetical protein